VSDVTHVIDTLLPEISVSLRMALVDRRAGAIRSCLARIEAAGNVEAHEFTDIDRLISMGRIDQRIDSAS
jgi:hypothetical protein